MAPASLRSSLLSPKASAPTVQMAFYSRDDRLRGITRERVRGPLSCLCSMSMNIFVIIGGLLVVMALSTEKVSHHRDLDRYQTTPHPRLGIHQVLGSRKAARLSGSNVLFVSSSHSPRVTPSSLCRLRGGGDDMDVDAEIVSQDANPKAAEAEKQKGNDAYSKRDFAQAVEHFSRAVDLDPRNSVYLNNRAAAFMALEQLDKAEADVQLAISIELNKNLDDQDDKALGRSYSRLGTIHHKRGNYTGAIHWFKNSIVEHAFPETSMKLRDAEKALEEVKAKAYLDPEKSTEAKLLGNELFRKGDFTGALKHYTEAIKRNPSDPKVWNNRAACYQKLYELRLGIKDSEKAVELDPNYVKGWSRLGQMYYGSRDLVKAKRAFERMKEIDPTNVDAQKGLDMCANAQQHAGNDPSEVQRRVQNDPEAMSIMQDPEMQKVLRELQTNPQSAQKWMADPVVSRKLQKLIEVGVIQTRPG